jgi:hypothetical protein
MAQIVGLYGEIGILLRYHLPMELAASKSNNAPRLSVTFGEACARSEKPVATP